MTNIIPSTPRNLAHSLPALSPSDAQRVIAEAQLVTEALTYPTFAAIVEAATGRLRSANSVRVYRDTWQRWEAFAAGRNMPPEALHAELVKGFVRTATKANGATLARSSKLRMLAAMRTLMSAAREVTANNPAVVQQYGAIADWTLPHDHDPQPEVEAEPTRAPRRALKRSGVLAVFDGVKADYDDRPLAQRRNLAVVHVLFYTGVRRAELAAMKWADVDFEAKTIHIPHGKGDKSRHVPMLGSCAEVLAQWRELLTAEAGERVYVFPAIGKGDKLREDAPISGNAVYNLCRRYDFRPHDARRTVGTTVARLAAVKEAQSVLGHANASTTLDHYVMGADASELAKSIELDY